MSIKKVIPLLLLFVLFLHNRLFAQLYGTTTCSNQVNVTCSAGTNWVNERKAVALILYPVQNADGSYQYEVDGITIKYIAVGTGTLVNNTCNYNIPYFLTAKHLLTNWKGADYSKWKFVFGYWSSNCAPNTYPLADNLQIIVGATVMASSSVTDFLLFKLNASPSNVTYAGWTTGSTAPASATILYHPNGDVMKITSSGAVVSSTSVPNHWDVNSMTSPTQGGASGAAIFDQNKHIVGQLHGGTGTCPYSIQAGKFNLSWNGEGTAQTRLKDYLDPYNQSASTTPLVGNTVSSSSLVADPNYKSKTISGPASIDYTVSQTYTYTIPNISSALAVSWQSSDPTVLGVTGTNATATVTIKKNFFGTVNLTATINTGCGFCTLAPYTITVLGFAPVCGQTIYKSGIGVLMSVSMPGATQYRWREGSATAPLISGATGSSYTYPYATLCPNNGGGIYFNGDVYFYVEAYRPSKGWSLPCTISYHFNCSSQTISNINCGAFDPNLARVVVSKAKEALSNVDKWQHGVHIFPQPAGNEINIWFKEMTHEPAVVQLITVNGAVLASKKLPAGITTTHLNVDAIQNGMYFLKISGEQQSVYEIIIHH